MGLGLGLGCGLGSELGLGLRLGSLDVQRTVGRRDGDEVHRGAEGMDGDRGGEAAVVQHGREGIEDG